jgi:hypothetical protein
MFVRGNFVFHSEPERVFGAVNFDIAFKVNVQAADADMFLTLNGNARERIPAGYQTVNYIWRELVGSVWQRVAYKRQRFQQFAKRQIAESMVVRRGLRPLA